MAVLRVPPDAVVTGPDEQNVTTVSAPPGSTVVVDLTDDGEQVPTRRQRVAAAAAAVWRRLDAELGIWEWIVAVGVVMLLVGLWVAVGFGVACAVVGALVVWMGIAGGRAAAAARNAVEVDQAPAGPGDRPVLAEVA
ncbi:hypothetical protein ACN27G_06050 [Plantactinospora sp. WMMB334]|uniref:hypothetical protein n=1 Tax=Plantactinospora sp. WMMB334 TaxID=3404119 RepID=UPI003B9514E1